MQVVIRRYVRGTFVETYEQTFEVPDDIDMDDSDAILEYLDDEGELYGDWGEEISFDDNIDEVEHEVEEVKPNSDSED